jgi:hypothetical protein
MLRTTAKFVRGTTIAAALCFAPVYAATAQQNNVAELRTENLKPGQFVWNPERSTSGPVEVVVSLPQRLGYVYRGGTLIGVSTISAGKPGHETPLGTFPILQKRKEHYSNKYNNAPMPFMQRLNWHGVALHGGHVPNHHASRGCVRFPTKFAQHLFGVTSLGSTVFITHESPRSAEAALAMARSDRTSQPG